MFGEYSSPSSHCLKMYSTSRRISISTLGQRLNTPPGIREGHCLAQSNAVKSSRLQVVMLFGKVADVHANNTLTINIRRASRQSHSNLARVLDG